MKFRLAAAIATTGVAAWALRPRAGAYRELLGPGVSAAIARDGADSVLLTLGGAALWLVVLWLLLALTALASSTMPGEIGAWGERISRAIAPVGARRMLALVVGIGIVAAPAMSATASAASDPSTGIAAPGWPLNAPAWPISSTPVGEAPAPEPPADADADTDADADAGQDPRDAASDAPDAPSAAPEPQEASDAAPDWTASGSDPTGAMPDGHGTPPAGLQTSSQEVRVASGDSLWSIAAAHLPAGSSDIDIATAWPAWYRANADAVGDDPHLLHPGQVLRAPDAP